MVSVGEAMLTLAVLLAVLLALVARLFLLLGLETSGLPVVLLFL